MKQRFYNWIYRTLRRLGIKSTEYVNLNDYFEQVKEISDPHNPLVYIGCKISRYGVDGEVRTEYNVYAHEFDHYDGKNPGEAVKKYKEAIKNRNSSSVHTKETLI